jgi:hypothetical protein
MPSPVHLDCCKHWYPAGYAPHHSSWCPLFPNQKLSDVERHTLRRKYQARREAEAQASASKHPTAPDEPWWIEHDRKAAQGQCDDPVCFRCDALDDNPPYEEEVI